MIAKFILQIILQVLLKLLLTLCSKELLGQVMFYCLHRIVKLTKNTKDDHFVDKLEKLYYGISDTTDQQSEDLLRKIKDE
jgi:hypothetical protein